jgi:hypothetical protein
MLYLCNTNILIILNQLWVKKSNQNLISFFDNYYWIFLDENGNCKELMNHIFFKFRTPEMT